jgi:hypothetical protein
MRIILSVMSNQTVYNLWIMYNYLKPVDILYAYVRLTCVRIMYSTYCTFNQWSDDSVVNEPIGLHFAFQPRIHTYVCVPASATT